MNHLRKGSVIKHQYVWYEKPKKKKKSIKSIQRLRRLTQEPQIQLRAPLRSSGLAIHQEVMGTTEPVTAENSIQNEF